MVQPLDDLGEAWPLHDETASPGYYAATLDTGIRCEITVGEKVAVHRYTFPESRSSRIVVDLSCGGLAIEHGRTIRCGHRSRAWAAAGRRARWCSKGCRCRCTPRSTGGAGGRCSGTTGGSSRDERRTLAWRAREHALAFDRGRVFDGIFPAAAAAPARDLRLPEESIGAHQL